MFKNLFSILNLVLVTVLLFFGVKLCYQILSAKLIQASSSDLSMLADTGTNVKDTGALNRRQSVKPVSAYQAINDRDLFKTKESVTPEKTATDIELAKLQQTSLQLKLYGTITGHDTQDYAVIEDAKARKQGLYRVGDTIQNAEIKLILRRKVVLSVNGKDEILLMEDEKKGDKQMGSRRRRYAPEEFSPVEPDMGDRFNAGETVSIDRDKINSSLRNINQLMSQVKVRPHFKDGRPDGLLLSHVQQNSIFKDMGLQNGDIVKGVNGKEIQSVDDALKFYDNLKSSSSVELQIERQGQSQTINYQIE